MRRKKTVSYTHLDNEGNALTLMDVLGTQADEVMDTVEARIQLDHVRRVMAERLEAVSYTHLPWRRSMCRAMPARRS